MELSEANQSYSLALYCFYKQKTLYSVNTFYHLAKYLKYIVFLSFFTLVFQASYAQNSDAVEALNLKIKNSKVDTTIARAYHDLAEILYQKNVDTIFPLCEQSNRIIKTSLSQNPSPDKKKVLQGILAKNYYLIGYAHTINGNLKKALEFNEKALYLFSEVGSDNEIGEVYNNMGAIYIQLGSLKKAAELNDLAIKYLKESDKKRTLAYIYNNTAVINYKLENFTKAEDYVLQALRLYQEVDDQKGRIRTINTYGSLLKKNGDTLKAIDKYKEAINQCKKLSFTQVEAVAHNNLGVTYMQLFNYEKAIKHLNKALSLLQEINYQYGIANTYHSLGELYFKMEQYDKAEEYLNKALVISEKFEFNENIRKVAHLLSKNSKKQNQWKKAYEMISLYHQMQEKVLAKQKENEIILKEIKTEKEQERVKRELLHEKEIAIANEKNKTQKVFIIFTSAALVIAALFSLILFQRLKTSRKQRSIIENQNKEQKLLLQEIHHRVKNNFQIISSLLKLQSIQENDPKIEEQFNKAINRISSMAVVHEVIYGQTQFTQIKAQSYFEKLVNNIQQGLTHNTEKVNISFVDNYDISFSMQTLIPLGISVNELITNSLKHAFEFTSENYIEIELHKTKDGYTLLYKDNGVGIKNPEQKSFGLELINTIIEQIDGNITFSNKDDWNTYIEIRFKEQ